MTPEGNVDYAAVERLAQRQVDAGINALIVCATTGEAPTLQDDEHIEVIRRVVAVAKGKTAKAPAKPAPVSRRAGPKKPSFKKGPGKGHR
jgi:hypothetical protein